MNKERRKLVASAAALIDEAKTLLEQARDEERETRENLPENLQDGELGERMDGYADRLDELIDELENLDFSEFDEGRA